MAICITDADQPPTYSQCAPLCPDENADLCPPSSFGGEVTCDQEVVIGGEISKVCSLSCKYQLCPDGMSCTNLRCVWPTEME
jgi:hypothetical protein